MTLKITTLLLSAYIKPKPLFTIDASPSHPPSSTIRTEASFIRQVYVVYFSTRGRGGGVNKF